MGPDSGDQGKEKSRKEGSEGQKSTQGVFLTKCKLMFVRRLFFCIGNLCIFTHLREERCDQERTAENQSHDRRRDERLGSLYVEVLGPHRRPPRVCEMLPVEDIEGVCRSAKNADAEDDNKASNDGLSQVERSGVDLHLDDSRCWRSCFFCCENVQHVRGCKDRIDY